MALRAPHFYALLLISAAMVGCRPAKFSSQTGKPNPITQDQTPVPKATPSPSPSGLTTQHNEQKKRDIKISLLIDNMRCAFCHIQVHGDIGSAGDVQPARFNSVATVHGKWFVSGKFLFETEVKNGVHATAKVSGGVVTDYANTGHELPVGSDGKPAFPDIDFESLTNVVSGTVTSTIAPSLTVKKVLNGNAVFRGTKSAPIDIRGDVLVRGDVVLKGVYRGRGTIYATGNIYVPANLVANTPVTFPYPSDVNAANTKAAQDVQTGQLDALGLAANGSILIADLENFEDSAQGGLTGAAPGPEGQTRYRAIYDHTETLPRFNRTALNVNRVYSWYAGGEKGYQELYETVDTCVATKQPYDGKRSFTRLDAFLYARNTVAGICRGAVYSINGGIIARDLHVISGAGRDNNGSCSSLGSHLNYDYRFRNGIGVLDALAAFFQ